MSYFAAFLLIVFGSGCATSQTIRATKGETYFYKTKKVAKKPDPIAYAFLPVSVVVDITTIPFWTCVTVAVNLGLMEPPF